MQINAVYARNRTKQLIICFAAASALSGALARADITITPPSNGRVVVGTRGFPTFNLTNTGAGTQFDATLTPASQFYFLQSGGSSPVTAPAGQKLNSFFVPNSTASVVMNDPLPGAAGDTDTVTLNVQPVDSQDVPTGAVVSSNAQYQLVENRSLTGSVNLGNLGRFMLSSLAPVSFSINGGTQDNNHATQVTASAGGHAIVEGPDNGAFEITNASTFVYNGPNQSHTFAITPLLGAFNEAATPLPASNVTSSNSAGIGGDEYQAGVITNQLFSGETLTGTNFNLSGVTITGSGDALENRYIQSGAVNIGRFMQDGPETTVTTSTSTGLYSAGGDTTETRLQLAPFDIAQQGIEASLSGPVTFNKSTFANVTFTGTTPLVKSGIGAVYNTFSVGNKISSLENLPGETPQTTLTASTYYNILQDNRAVANDINVYTYGNQDLSHYTFSNPSVQMVYGTDSHTYLRLNQSFTLPNSASQTITLTPANGGIVGEGLAGENDQSSLSYQANVVTVGHATLGGTPDSTVLGDGSTFVLSDHAGLYADAETNLSLSGNSDLFTVSNSTTGNLNDTAFGTNIDLKPGASQSWTVSVNTNKLPTLPPNSLGLTYQAYITANVTDYFSGTLPNAASGQLFGYGQTQIHNWTLQATVPGTAINSGSTVLQPGSNLGQQGVTLTSTRSTTASLIGSATLAAQTTVGLSFTDPSTADPAMQGAAGFSGLESDIVTITGLDHVQQVIEINFTKGVSANAIDWYDAADGAWINSILGNYNITNLDLADNTLDVYGVPENIDTYVASMRVNESYGSYIAGLYESEPNNPDPLPPLGTYGVDPNGTVWAVVDHNSSFAVVPEPSSIAILAMIGAGILSRRRRPNRSL